MTERDQYIRVDEIAARTGINPRTLKYRLASGTIPIFRDPLDLRRRMIAVSDLESFTTPRRVEKPTAA